MPEKPVYLKIAFKDNYYASRYAARKLRGDQNELDGGISIAQMLRDQGHVTIEVVEWPEGD